MEKQQAIQKLEKRRFEIDKIKNLYDGTSSPEFTKWQRDTEIAIENIFDENSRHTKDFKDINYFLGSFSLDDPHPAYYRAYITGLGKANSILSSFIDEINEYWDDIVISPIMPSGSTIEKIELLCNRFHSVARQLRHRHSNRATLEIADEYDAQDLFHALLTLYFDDIRDEEWTPSYAGACSRVDFLLKQENIVIELKKTRKSLARKEISDQLIIDIQRYKETHPNCKNLICFVYDPETMIFNPKGLENDLTKVSDGLDVRVFIRPN